MQALYKRFGTLGSFLLIGALFCAAATAAAVVGQSTTGASSIVAYTQLTLSKPSDASVGDLLFANITFQGGNAMSITVPEGWTAITRTANGSNVSIASFYKVVSANEPSTYGWSLAATTKAVGGITRFSGIDVINPIDVSAGSSGKGKAATAPSVTTTTTENQLVTLFAADWGMPSNGFFSTPSGMTESYEISNRPLGPSTAMDTAVQQAAGPTGQKTSNLSSLIKPHWVAQTITLRSLVVATSTLKNGLVSYWKFDEQSGDAADSTTSGNTLTNNNSATFTPGKINNSTQMSREQGQYFAISDNLQSGLDVTTGLTIAGWVRYDSLPSDGNYMYLVSKWQDGSNSGGAYFLSLFNNSGTLKLYTTLFDGSTFEDIQRNWAPSIGVWYHIALTWSAASGVGKMYINGVQLGSDAPTTIVSIQNNDIRFKVGANDNSGGNAYQFQDGAIDEIGIWSKALTDSEITTLYGGGSGLPFSSF